MNKIIITAIATIMRTSAFAGVFNQVQPQNFIEASGTETTTAGSATGGAANSNSSSVDNSVTIGSLFGEYSLDSSIWGEEGNEITFGANYTFGEADVSDATSSRTEVAEDAAGSGSTGTVTYLQTQQQKTT